VSGALEPRFIALALANPVNRAILARLPALGLADAWLVSGCLFQTVWNRLSERPVDYGIKDYDIFYFDGSDLSWEAEDAAIKRCAEAFSDLDGVIEVRNQARVHLWYEDKFGLPYDALTSSCHGIREFLELTSMIGMRLTDGGGYEVYAPSGLDRVFDMTITPNDGAPHFSAERYRKKTGRWRACWPEIREVA